MNSETVTITAAEYVKYMDVLVDRGLFTAKKVEHPNSPIAYENINLTEHAKSLFADSIADTFKVDKLHKLPVEEIYDESVFETVLLSYRPDESFDGDEWAMLAAFFKRTLKDSGQDKSIMEVIDKSMKETGYSGK